MKATLVERDGDRAMVRLTPCWLARWFGDRESIVELEWLTETPRRFAGWYAVGSRRWLCNLSHYRLIEAALDFVPVAEPPRASARPALRVVRDRSAGLP